MNTEQTRAAGERYDAIIIGSGQAGTPLAGAMAKAGWRTVLIERAHVGGTCVNAGCTPTKTMIASARTAYLARRAADYGVVTGTVTVDMAKVRARKRAMVEAFRSGSQRRLEGTQGLDLVMGEARFTGPKSVEVLLSEGGRRTLTAETIVIDTGTRPSIPSLPGLKGVPFLNATTIMELRDVPEHLLVIGGGYIGLEFGQMFRRFGSKVTLVQRATQLVPHEDEDVAQEIKDILTGEGVDVHLDTVPVEVDSGSGMVELTVRTSQGTRTLTGSHLLLAAGRVPNTDRLHLPTAGIVPDAKGFIPVNERLETSVPGVYAVGDVNGGPAFTHIAYDDYRVLKRNLLQGGSSSTSDRPLPYTVFIDPQLGRIGITERKAHAQGLDVRVARLPMRASARALETDETRGFMKAIVDANTGRILGAAVLGVEGGEVMTVLQIAMMGDVPYSAIRDGVFAHPTLSEALNSLFAALET